MQELTYKQGGRHISQSKSTRNHRRYTGRHLLPFHHTAVNRALLWSFFDWHAQAVCLVVSTQLRMKKSFLRLFSLSHPDFFLSGLLCKVLLAALSGSAVAA